MGEVNTTLEHADHESRADEHHHDALRLWLRLLTCTTLIEGKVRARLREEFATTLPRFDLLAQLERYPDGLKMGELSQRMMVTGGNVTGITDQLVKEGLVERVPLPGDRRALKVRLTRVGRRSFSGMAKAHERWIVDLLAGLSDTEQRTAYRVLGKLKTQMRARSAKDAR
jgi:DNA-binding MarR family transcriptional regulator